VDPTAGVEAALAALSGEIQPRRRPLRHFAAPGCDTVRHPRAVHVALSCGQREPTPTTAVIEGHREKLALTGAPRLEECDR
jgi:hypothetical protein